MRDVWAELERVARGGEEGALVTVTHTEGSAYQREGTKMIFRDRAEPIGTISGGCLEADLFEHCRKSIAEGSARIIRYENGGELDLVFGTGSGCEGKIELLIEPLALWRTPAALALLSEICRRVAAGRRVAVATLLRRGEDAKPVLARVVVDSAGSSTGEAGDASLRELLLTEADAALHVDARRPSRKVEAVVAGVRSEVLVDVDTPAQRLVVFGAGEDARPLVAIAAASGMRVFVADWRSELLDEARLPHAEALVNLRPEDFPGRISLAAAPAVMLMSHNYLADRAVLERLFADPSPLSYLGVLGPRARTARLLGELAVESAAAREKAALVRTPAGLDLGADTPEEIALSIVAEMLAVRRHGSGRSLRELGRHE
jgi:xanthine dehydrogenase accessory factor